MLISESSSKQQVCLPQPWNWANFMIFLWIKNTWGSTLAAVVDKKCHIKIHVLKSWSPMKQCLCEGVGFWQNWVVKAWITFIVVHWWSHHLMVFPEDDSNFRRLELLGKNKLYPSPQLLTYEMRRVVLPHPSSLLCTTLPWLRNRRTKLPREKSQKWSQMGLFSYRLIFFFRNFFPTVMKNWLAQNEHRLCYCIQVIVMRQMSLVLVLSL